MNEAKTRAERIDPDMRTAGWRVVEGSKVVRVHAITAGWLGGRTSTGSPTVRINR